MKKNYSSLIRNKKERTLTAKGYKFLWDCIDVIALQHNLSRYSHELRPLKEKLKKLLTYLLIDEEKSIKEIKSMIANRAIKNTKIQ